MSNATVTDALRAAELSAAAATSRARQAWDRAVVAAAKGETLTEEAAAELVSAARLLGREARRMDDDARPVRAYLDSKAKAAALPTPEESERERRRRVAELDAKKAELATTTAALQEEVRAMERGLQEYGVADAAVRAELAAAKTQVPHLMKLIDG